MIQVGCANCGAQFQTEDQYAGQTTACPTCGTPLVIPAAVPAAALVPAGAAPTVPTGHSAAVPGVPTGHSGVSIAGFVLGLLALILSFIVAVPCIGLLVIPIGVPVLLAAFICSIVGLATARSANRKKGLAAVGLVLSVVAVIWGPLALMLFVGGILGLGAAASSSSPGPPPSRPARSIFDRPAVVKPDKPPAGKTGPGASDPAVLAARDKSAVKSLCDRITNNWQGGWSTLPQGVPHDKSFLLYASEPGAERAEALSWDAAVRSRMLARAPGRRRPTPNSPLHAIGGPVALIRCALVPNRRAPGEAVTDLLVVVRRNNQWELAAAILGDWRLTGADRYDPAKEEHREIGDLLEQLNRASANHDADLLRGTYAAGYRIIFPDPSAPENCLVVDPDALLKAIIESKWAAGAYEHKLSLLKVAGPLAVAVVDVENIPNSGPRESSTWLFAFCRTAEGWRFGLHVSGDWRKLLASPEPGAPPAVAATSSVPAIEPPRPRPSGPSIGDVSRPKPAEKPGPAVEQPADAPTVVATVAELDKALDDLGAQRVIWVRLGKDQVEGAKLGRLRQWVRAGGVLWSDTDLVRMDVTGERDFGFRMVAAPEGRRRGEVYVQRGTSVHPVVEGLGRSVGYVLSDSGLVVSTVTARGMVPSDTALLLGWPPARGKSVIQAACAMRSYGRGLVFYRPSQVTPEEAGKRFEENLRSYSFKMSRAATPPAASPEIAPPEAKPEKPSGTDRRKRRRPGAPRGTSR